MTDTARVGLVIAAFFAAGAVNTAWLPLWFADHGLSPAEIGLILGATSLLRVVGVPGGGWLADRMGRRSIVTLGAAAIAAAAAATLPALHGLTPLLVAAAMLGVAGSLLAPLTDAIMLGLAACGRLEYGRTRAWGSISYMAATAGAGALLAHTGTRIVPALLALGYGAAAIGAAFLPDTPFHRRSIGNAGPFRNRAFRLVLVATALIQGSHAAYYGFAAVYWRSIGIGDALIGLLIAEGIVVEVALFLWGRTLVERIGPARLTALAATAAALRWTVTALTAQIAVLALVQVLHSATFACQHLSTMQVLRRMPPEQSGMAQTLLAALGFSLPTGLLIWLVGQLYAPLGGYVFLPMAAIGGAALLTVGPLARATR